MTDRNPVSTPPIDLTLDELGTLLVRAGETLLEADRWSFLGDAGDQFETIASTDTETLAYDRWTSLPGRSYETGRACVIDDRLATRSAAAPSVAHDQTDRVRSLCCVPIGDTGLLLGESSRPHAFSDADKQRLTRFIDDAFEAYEPGTLGNRSLVDGGRTPNDDGADPAEEIVDILSHDLTNPLTILEGKIRLARETGDLGHLDDAMSALDRVMAIQEELIHLARTGNLVEATDSFTLESVAKTAWSNVETERAMLEIESDTRIEGDYRALCHVFENLFENATTHAGPAVTVRVGPTTGGFHVEDDGPGIPAESRDRVLERGFSVEAGSSGLGLHIVNSIADAHGWDVRVSESVDGGARFEFVTGDGT